ncbi:putative HAT dimerization domain, ribonuclease H-like superfamily [Helianthus annuus]|uniref:HAT dimerization domain, ribonuclease H-like superfamily n=1 Tax=Helianthus annuus TaxID=4232 RepID=A0A9K3NF88_HELAN|nr:putative HAT dimerization domain, ribonuclease H-like superfamily [Helianthus annuus]KAJ0904400.1 putative HAT dimerization domain, ribonuclease H-like superfamily [Helianthus annuus]
MARGTFCIPITTVASESAFSAGGRVLDDYRSSLSKDMAELLVCGIDWIKSASKSFIKTLEEEENLEIPIPTSDGASS